MEWPAASGHGAHPQERRYAADMLSWDGRRGRVGVWLDNAVCLDTKPRASFNVC